MENFNNAQPDRSPDFESVEINQDNCYYSISKQEEIRRNIIQKEKDDKKVLETTKSRLIEHASIVKHGAMLLVIISLLTFFAALYLIHLESINRQLESPTLHPFYINK
jgi:hypothetical protein